MARPDYESIEQAYAQPANVLDALPSTTESREAGRLLDLSRDLAYRAREKVGPEPAQDSEPDAVVGMVERTVWTTCFAHNHLHLHVEGSCNLSS